jgi:hypothetical protein
MWIECFKTGRHTDSAGNSRDFTTEDLDSIVLSYSQRLQENPGSLAPLVKGHPESDSPAIGWVESLARRGNFLIAKIRDITEDTALELKEKKFRNVSISLYSDMSLNHIGLLGAANPAVKGLKPIEFIAEMPDFIAEMPDFISDEPSTELNENDEENPQQISAENEIESLRRKIADFEEKAITADYEDFAESLVATSRIAKSGKDNLKRTLHYLHSVDLETENQFTLVDQFKNFISKLSGGIHMKEFATKENAVSNSITNSFAGRKLNPERSELHSQIIRKMNENPEWTYEEALLSIEN